jgi:hypothetical protein
MNTELNNTTGGNNQQNTGGEERGSTTEKSTEISLPKIDRPEGPFEHSGETARWTEEEKAEKTEQGQQGSGNQNGG